MADVNRVHSGWLTKSPPDKKPPGRLNIFKAHWRRRYFVLSSCRSQSPGGGDEAPPAYYLHYYDNDRSPKKSSREKGCIDLSSCEEILAQLESDCYDNVFSLRTQHKGRSRTYCLAADSVEEMNQWINCLTKVLQMDDFDPLMSRPDTPFQKSSGTNPPATCRRHRTYPLIRSGCAPSQTPAGAAANQQAPVCQTPNPDKSPPPNFSVELAATRYGERTSLSCSSLAQSAPPPSRPPYFLGGGVDSDNDDASPPPSLPAKTLRNRLREIDGGVDWRAGESHVRGSSEAADPEFRRSRGGGGDDSVMNTYDFLPAGRRSVRSNDDDENQFQFPTPTSFSDYDELSSPDVLARRKSTPSYLDAFDSADDKFARLKSDSTPFSTSIQVTQMTRSFRRSTSRSDPSKRSVTASTEPEDVKERI